MATTRGQRIGIWVIAATMMIGTIGGFIAMMVQPGNDARDRAEIESLQKEYQTAQDEHTKKVKEQTAKLNETSYPTVAAQQQRVAPFTADEVKELKTEDIVLGSGAEVTKTSDILVYYIGWNPKGEVFDGSLDGDKLKDAFPVANVAKASVIAGWQEGLVGMKIGGVRELTIPADKAYGEQGSGDKIPANTPLKFVIYAAAESPKQPEMPQKLKDYYKRLYGIDF